MRASEPSAVGCVCRSDAGQHATRTFAAHVTHLLTPTHRYSRYTTGEDGSYELGRGGDGDDERTNLAVSDPALRAEMVDQLASEMLALSDTARGAPAAL